MGVLQVSKKTSVKVEKAELLIGMLCLINGIHLSKTEIKVLAYYTVYGLKESTDEQLIKSKVVPKVGSFRNLKTRLSDLGFLKRSKGIYKTYELNLDANFKLDEIDQIVVKITS